MKIAISELAHHPLNSEIYELDNIDDLASSISELGLLQSLVIDCPVQRAQLGVMAAQGALDWVIRFASLDPPQI